MARKAKSEKMEVTISIDQTVMADYMAMLEDINQICTEKGCHPAQTLSETLEQNMKAGLQAYHIQKAIDRYQ